MDIKQILIVYGVVTAVIALLFVILARENPPEAPWKWRKEYLRKRASTRCTP